MISPKDIQEGDIVKFVRYNHDLEDCTVKVIKKYNDNAGILEVLDCGENIWSKKGQIYDRGENCNWFTDKNIESVTKAKISNWRKEVNK